MVSPPTEPDDRVEGLLDQLVPRPGPPWRRFVVGIGLTTLVVTGALAWTLGVVVPNPAANTSYSGGQSPAYVPERNAIAVGVYLPNNSKRTIRLTGVGLEDAPGVHLIDVGARLDPEIPQTDENCVTEGDVTSCTAAAEASGPYAPWPADLSALPVTVPAGRSVRIHLLLDPTSCQGPDPDELPWGHIDATFDFGDGGFPGWLHTIRVQDALAVGDQDLRLSDGEGFQVYPPIDGRPDDGLGLLAAACRLIDDN